MKIQCYMRELWILGSFWMWEASLPEWNGLKDLRLHTTFCFGLYKMKQKMCLTCCVVNKRQFHSPNFLQVIMQTAFSIWMKWDSFTNVFLKRKWCLRESSSSGKLYKECLTLLVRTNTSLKKKKNYWLHFTLFFYKCKNLHCFINKKLLL